MVSKATLLVLAAFATLALGNPYGGLAVLSSCDAEDDSQLWRYNATLKNVVHVATGLCLDVQSKGTSNGTPVQIYQCMYDNRKNQIWGYDNATRELIGISGKCLSVEGGCSANNTKAVINDCENTLTMQWTLRDGNIISALNGMCLSVAPEPEYDKLMNKPFIIGHRGFVAKYPENTLPGFVAAAELVDGFETDLHLTKDGKIVLSHDEKLDRCTNCTGKISDLTFDYVTTQCDAGGTFVPSFEDAVVVAKEKNALIVMDMKAEGMELEIKRILEKHEFYNVIASMRTEKQRRAVSAQLPHVPRQRLLSTPRVATPEYFADEVGKGVMGYSCNYVEITEKFIRNAHRDLLSVFAWTVDNISDLKKLFRRGIDGVITNDPELAKRIALDMRSNTLSD